MENETAQGSYVEPGGFKRDTNYITTRITADGSEGYPVEAGRYRLVVSRACPWANRAIIVRRLLGLEPVLSMGICGPTHDKRSWTFDLDPGGLDPVLGIPRIADAYFARDPDYPRGITVPAIVDVITGQVVTNDFARLTLDLSTEWTALHRPGAPDLYPVAHRSEIDELITEIFHDVNNGVYKCGFAGDQESYEAAYDVLFARLDRLSERLTDRRYLVGDTITEVDIRLFCTLVRFDAVYHGCRSSGPTRATSSRLPVSATPSTSITSSGTITRSTPTSIRPPLFRRVRTSRTGSIRMAGMLSGAVHLATEPLRQRSQRTRKYPRLIGPFLCDIRRRARFPMSGSSWVHRSGATNR